MENVEERIAKLEAQIAELLQRLDSAPGVAGAGSQLMVGSATINKLIVNGELGLSSTMPNNPLHISADGGAGTGQSSGPPAMLQVKEPRHINVILDRTDTEDHMTLIVGSLGTGILFGDSNTFFISAGPYAERNTLNGGKQVFTILPSGNVGFGFEKPNYPIHVGIGGTGMAYCDGSTWYDSSSIEFKEDVAALDVNDALSALAELEPLTFKYKGLMHDRTHVGFNAEDVPELVASADRKGLGAMGIVAILTSVVKEQQQSLLELRQKLSHIEARQRLSDIR